MKEWPTFISHCFYNHLFSGILFNNCSSLLLWLMVFGLWNVQRLAISLFSLWYGECHGKSSFNYIWSGLFFQNLETSKWTNVFLLLIRIFVHFKSLIFHLPMRKINKADCFKLMKNHIVVYIYRLLYDHSAIYFSSLWDS